MNNRKQLICIYFFICTLLSTSVVAQKITPFKTWNDADLYVANSAIKIKEMSFQEKNVVFYINLVRINGSLFAETYLKDYVEETDIPKNKYYKSLINTLKEQPRLSVIQPNLDLNNEAIKHAKEMGRTGRKGHRSEDFKGFSERIIHLQEKFEKIKESNQYGFPDALSIVVDLLIDNDYESLRHRKMLLDPDLQSIGVGIRSHKKYLINTSILMAGNKKKD